MMTGPRHQPLSREEMEMPAKVQLPDLLRTLESVEKGDTITITLTGREHRVIVHGLREILHRRVAAGRLEAKDVEPSHESRECPSD
jgi:ribosomal 50S subunit-recycling heat shock protein